MKLIGIVSEYNPFHNGHLYHIEQSKALVGEESAVVCVMSGDFVQRGEAAVFSKFARAEAAVRGGADLVIELPPAWSLQSAEGFARGAVGLLSELGCVDYLSFGSECGDMSTLNMLATYVSDPMVMRRMKQELEKGVSFAAARQTAMDMEYGSISEHLRTPNNILAVEYLKALYELRCRMEPITVQRQGADHDEPEGSASDIRARLRNKQATKGFVPKACQKVYREETKRSRGPVKMQELETALISRFRMLDERAFMSLPDEAEGLGNRLCAAAHEETTLDAVLSAAKTKRYALSRIRRMLMCAALGITERDTKALPPYARVLAMNDRGRKALKLIQTRSKIPVIIKPASIRDESEECRHIFGQSCAAHDLFVMAYGVRAERRGGEDFRTSPFVL